MKLHTAILRDRAIIRGEHLIKASKGNGGASFEIRVAPEQAAEANRLHGGAPVTYQIRGGRKFFVA